MPSSAHRRAAIAPSTESYAGYGCHRKYDRYVFDRAATSPTAVVEAKRICSGCPVRGRCLSDAMAEEGTVSVQYRSGIRGGLTPEERFERVPKPPARRYVDVTATRQLADVLEQRGFTLSWISRELGRSHLQLPKARIDQDVAEAIANLADQIGPDLVMPPCLRGRPRPTLAELSELLPKAA
jgi:hypothetical protein